VTKKGGLKAVSVESMNKDSQQLGYLENSVLTERFIAFTEESLRACSVQAEKSVNMVAKILDDIVADSSRVSQLSQDTIAALASVRKMLETQKQKTTSPAHAQAERGSKQLLQQIMDALQVLGEHNSEVSQFVTPMIESLQFQDRIRQQMDNIPKMLRVWLTARKQFDNNALTLDDCEALQKKFGEDLLAVSISEQERNVIRANIPGLPVAENFGGDSFFF
jgi:hypothetical protein